MGSRGPAPTPTNILERRGSWRAAVREGEPRPPASAPAKPRWLPKEAAKIWDQVVPQLMAMGVLTEVDWSVLARFCELRAEELRWRRELAKEGHFIKGPNGRYVNPKKWFLDNARREVRKEEARLGMSPSDRTRIRLAPQEDDQGQKGDWWEK